MSWPFPFYVSNPFLVSLPSLGAISVWCPDLIPSPRGKKNSRLHAREFSFWMVTPQDFRHNFQYFELLILVFIIDTGKEFLSEGISWLLAKQNELSMSEWMPKGERGVQLVEVIPLNFETVFFFLSKDFWLTRDKSRGFVMEEQSCQQNIFVSPCWVKGSDCPTSCAIDIVM